MATISTTRNRAMRSRRGLRSGTRCGRAALVAALACCLLPAVAGAGDAGTAPRAVVEQTTNDVLAILRDQTLSSQEKQRRIETVVYARVDFDTLSRLVLARNWRRFSKPQQEEFVSEFKQHLSLTYGNNVDNYKNEGVEITGDREETRGDWTVQSKIMRGSAAAYLIDYRLRQTAGEWKIIDIVVEGVSLVANFRSQFQDIVSGGGPDRLLRLLREKNAKGEPLKS